MQPDGAILACAIVACISSAVAGQEGCFHLGWVWKNVIGIRIGLGDNSSVQHFVRFFQSAQCIRGRLDLYHCNYFHTPAFPSYPSSISDTDFTAAISLV